MTTRRTFIKSTSLLSAAFITYPVEFSRKKSLIGLQLYTVRDDMKKDPPGTLAKVAAIGYNSVEGATYTGSQKFYDLSPKDFSKLLKAHGLIIPSGHYRLGKVKDNDEIVKGTMLHDWEQAVDDAAEVGLKYMVCAWLDPEERKNFDDYRYVADQLNIAGEKCKKAGIQMCYHNHDFEFVMEDGTYPYDILLGADKDLVKMEMDLYWVTKAGIDPVDLINKNPGRFPLFHLKDMDNTPEHSFTEVGNGTINFKNIFANSTKAGLKYFFVEQDKCPGSPFDSIAKSISYIRKNLV